MAELVIDSYVFMMVMYVGVMTCGYLALRPTKRKRSK
jgi:hypothetical protein